MQVFKFKVNQTVFCLKSSVPKESFYIVSAHSYRGGYAVYKIRKEGEEKSIKEEIEEKNLRSINLTDPGWRYDLELNGNSSKKDIKAISLRRYTEPKFGIGDEVKLEESWRPTRYEVKRVISMPEGWAYDLQQKRVKQKKESLKTKDAVSEKSLANFE
ncbi:hypothetical protein SLS56_009102 [Neofusicoccum ribis]|uniref:Uncharacterized protein n=1 Tax=Neofusicoccum ribis TaxID=45134 RepID=A0ABR3SI54_9PEZI